MSKRSVIAKKHRRQDARWKMKNGPVTTKVNVSLDSQRYATHVVRVAVWKRDGGQCQYCGIEVGLDDCNIDHIRPWNRGGPTIASNLVVACHDCNKLKGRALIPVHLRPQ